MSKAHFPTFLKVIKCPFSCFFHFKCSFVWTKQPSDVLILRMAGTATHSLSEYLKQRRQQKSKLRLKSTSLQLSFQFIKFQRSHASSHSTLEGIQPLHHPSSVTQHFTQKLISPFQQPSSVPHVCPYWYTTALLYQPHVIQELVWSEVIPPPHAAFCSVS